MLLPATVLIAPEDLVTDYTIHVRHKGRWINVRCVNDLQAAEMLAEKAHRRSGLATEVRDSDGGVVMAFEPPVHV